MVVFVRIKHEWVYGPFVMLTPGARAPNREKPARGLPRLVTTTGDMKPCREDPCTTNPCSFNWWFLIIRNCIATDTRRGISVYRDTVAIQCKGISMHRDSVATYRDRIAIHRNYLPIYRNSAVIHKYVLNGPCHIML